MRLQGSQFDIAVVGASLAGCTTATLLGRAGLRIALIDKHSGEGAYKKLCGHYIQASALPVLERLGLVGAIEAGGGVRNGADVWTRFGVVASPEPPGERPYGYSIRRSKLDPIARALACSTPGVDYMPGLEAVALRGGRDAVTGVEIRDRGGRVSRVRARLVVGADGRGSTIARLAGARERRAGNERFCYMAYFSGVRVPGAPGGRLWLLEPDAAIAAPNDDGLTVLAAFLHKRRLPEFKADRGRVLKELFAALPEPPGLDGAELAGRVLGFTDYGLVSRDAAPLPGLALAGDAALTSDPLMAVGCGWALQSGAWLADAVTPALTDECRLDPVCRGRDDTRRAATAGGAPSSTLAAALRRYRRTHRRRLGGHHRMLVSGARARTGDPVQRLLFAAGARDPRTAALLARYAERSIPPRRLLSPRTLGRAAYVEARTALAGRSSTAAASASSAAVASGWRPPGGSSA